MRVIIVGTGKLATELIRGLQVGDDFQLLTWENAKNDCAKSIVVHAGSGRELSAITNYCQITNSTLIELATGSEVEKKTYAFPIVLCPNTNILMLKFMYMFELCGHLFASNTINIIESHQASKLSTPGTAVSIAHHLGLSEQDIVSIRDPEVQKAKFGIPQANLARHAYHEINIQDGACSIKLESRVFGDAPYSDGVSRILAAVRLHELENRKYSVLEFIKNGWL